MRKRLRVVVLFVVGLLSTAVLGVITALMAAVSLAATALIVPGTGDPNPQHQPLYMDHARDRYIAPFTTCNASNCVNQAVPYSASFFPFVIFSGWCEPGRCDTWNQSVQTGVDSLHSALVAAGEDDEPIVVFGYSQGGAVVSNELRAIADNPVLLEKISSVVLIGNAYNPDGGLFTRLGFLPTIPFLDITFGPATPIDTGIPITGIGFEYDPVMYAPTFWGNGLAMINAFAAFDTVHGFYLTPDENAEHASIAYGYTEAELAAILDDECGQSPHCRVDSEGNEYWMIPAKSLPMMNLIMSVVPGPLKPFVQPIVDLTSPVAKVLIDLGYDWSGDPGQTRWLSPLPFSPTTNWLQVSVDLVEAVVEGIENAFGGGGSIMIAPPDDENVLALRTSTSEAEAVVAEEQEDTTEGLKTEAVEDDSAAVDQLEDATVKEDQATTDEDEAATDDEDEATTDEDEATTEDDAATDETEAEVEVEVDTDVTDTDTEDATESDSTDTDADSDGDTGQAAA